MVVTAITLFLILALFVLGGIAVSLYVLLTKKNMNDQKTKAIDIFLYLGIGISLIVSVTNFLQIVFRAIEEKFPDVLAARQYVDMYNSDARMSIATLVVMFPIYIGLSYYVSKNIQKYIYKRDLMIRKVFSYIAIFVTVLTLIGTLVSVIYSFLGGELSVRFGLKALSVFVVALSVFFYYFYSLRRDFIKVVKWPIITGGVVSIVVMAALVWSISIIGSPSTMRAKRIDNTRLSDLSSLQQQIYSKLQTGDKLPADLLDLSDAFQGYIAPVDPVTKEAYGYVVVQQPTFTTNFQTGKKTMVKQAEFQLCATFDTERSYTQGMSGMMSEPAMISSKDVMYSASNYYYEGDLSPFWNHKAERTCFRRIISPEMYYGK